MNRQLVVRSPAASGSSRWLPRMTRRVVFERLARLQRGRLVVCDEHEQRSFGTPAAGEPSARIAIHDPRMYADVVFGGSIGAAEAYMSGWWDCDDLTSALRVLLRNRAVIDDLETGAARVMAPLRRSLHWLNRNTRSGSRRNIAAHYDLGNEFFALWLDESLMYSAAVFAGPETTLAEASAAKNDMICRKLALQGSDRVLEIGTGWGGFALHAARNFGCRVTSLTISREQFDLARRRVQEEALGERVEVLLADYRELDPNVHGRFDKLVSIEMIEAVGHEYQPLFFRKCDEMLEPHGAMLLQAITIADHHYERARRSVDFIQRYIFPGSCLTSVTNMSAVLTRHTELRIHDLEEIGHHYATTLAHWRTRFRGRLAELRALGLPETFLRMWDYYFCYCEAGFIERAIGDVQLKLVKPEWRAA